MHAGRRFQLAEVLYWTRRDIYLFAVVAFIPTALYFFLDLHWLVIPWVAIGLVGTAAAFVVGFKNTQTYSRLWEARQIWGSIINSSRTWAIMVKDMVEEDKGAVQVLFYRHLAWVTALRYQLREPRAWENARLKSNSEYANGRFTVSEKVIPLETELAKFLTVGEQEYILTKKNRATQ